MKRKSRGRAGGSAIGKQLGRREDRHPGERRGPEGDGELDPGLRRDDV
jgi:hypothetical protein